jgi:hypothetical protein
MGFETVGEQAFAMGQEQQRDMLMRLRSPDEGSSALISLS